MRLLSHVPETSSTSLSSVIGHSWRAQERRASTVPGVRTKAVLQSEVERLTKANSELTAALVDLIAFATVRTSLTNECGDRIVDPRVLNARAVLTAVEAGL
jgi:hypothetical protein